MTQLYNVYDRFGRINKMKCRQYITVSTKGEFKYQVICPSGATIYFGNSKKRHYRDSANNYYTFLDSNNIAIRDMNRTKYLKILDKNNKLAYLNTDNVVFWELHFLYSDGD